MKRALLIAVLVLVPFAGLVAYGFSLLNDPPPVAVPERGPAVTPPPAIAPVKVGGPVRAALDVRVPVTVPLAPNPALVPAAPPPSALPVGAEPEPPEPSFPGDPVSAIVEPLVQQCFKDIAERVKGPIRVTVAYDFTPTGGFAAVAVKKASWPDPHLTACVVDAFEDARFEPSGLPMRRQTRTFTFGAADGGR